jgi:hypothetical protein
MTDRLSADLAGRRGSLVQQQTGLLQLHGESVRLQRLLVERLLGGAATANLGGTASHPEPPPWMSAPVAPNSPPPTQLSTGTSATEMHHAAPSPAVESTTVEAVVEPSPARGAEPAATPSAGVGVGENAGHAVRYYQSRVRRRGSGAPKVPESARPGKVRRD